MLIFRRIVLTYQMNDPEDCEQFKANAGLNFNIAGSLWINSLS